MYEIENVNKIIDIVDIGPFNYLKGDIKKVTNKANVIGNKVVDKLGF